MPLRSLSRRSKTMLSLTLVAAAVLAAYATVGAQVPPPTPSVSFKDASKTVNEKVGSVTLEVVLSNASNDVITVQYATADWSAVAPGDYTNRSGTLTFAAGTTSQPISIPIGDDGVAEQTESFGVNLSNPTNALIGQGSCTVTIEDGAGGPAAPVKVQFSASEHFVSENSGEVTFHVVLVGENKEKVTVKFATMDGTAKAGDDYVDNSGVLTFDPGVTERTFKVVFKNDLKVEGDETISLVLSEPTGAELGMPSTAMVTIEDRPPVLTVSAQKTAICAGPVYPPNHFTFITATLTDGTNPIAGETVSFSTDRGTLAAASGTTNAFGESQTDLTANEKASHGANLYQATVTASVGGQGGATASCKVEFQPTVVTLTATYAKLVTGETTPLKAGVAWNGAGIYKHALNWSAAAGFGLIQPGASTQTDADGAGTAVYESGANGGMVELQASDTSVTYFDTLENPKGVVQEDVKKPVLKIQRQKDGAGGYQDIVAGNNQDVLPGEFIDLKRQLDPQPRDAATGGDWTIPGTVFKSYSATDDKGLLVTGIAFDNDTATFCWADTGIGRAVETSMKIGKVEIKGTATLNVQKPIATFDIKIGETQIINNKLTFAKNANTDLGGIDFNGKVELPGGFGFAEDEWHFGQLIKPDLYYWWVDDGQKYKNKKNGAPFKCDDPWIYANANPKTPNQIKQADSPTYDLDATVETKVQTGASFEMYMMFKPAGTKSQYVPLKKLEWSYAGTATWNPVTMTWALSGAAGPPPGTAPVDCPTHPQWTERFSPADEYELAP